MNKILPNNIFTNPIGWGKRAVGKTWSYRLLQGSIIFSGIILFLVLKKLYAHTDYTTLPSSYHGAPLIFIFVIFYPLCYLKVLRALYLHFPDQIETLLADKNSKEKDNNNRACC